MSGLGIFTRALPASIVLERTLSLAETLYPKQNVALDVLLVPEMSIRVEVPGHQLRGHATVTALASRLAEKPYVIARTAAISIMRNPQQNHRESVKYHTDDGVTARFEITSQEQDKEQHATHLFAAIDAVAKTFDVTTYVDHIRGTLGKATDEAMQLRERSVADLVTQIDRQSKFLQDLTEQETVARRKHQEELDADYRERNKALEEAHSKWLADAEIRERERNEAFDKKEEAFKKRVEQFETREAKHMRRDLLKRIEEVLEKAKDFKVSGDTERKRDQVRIGVVVIVLVTLMIGWTMVKRIAAGDTAWQPFAALSASSVTLLSTLVYYLKWSDRWFREHADAEFAARRYRADILRASWVAELVSEWQTENEDREIPPELLAAFTRNIFRDSGGSKESEHPLEAVTGMMKRVTSVTIGKGTISVQGDDGGGSAPGKRPTKREKSDAVKHPPHADHGEHA